MRVIICSIWCLLLVVSLSALGCDEASLTPGDSEILVTPDSINFRTLNLGETESEEITIESTGTAPLQISNITIEGATVFPLVSLGGEAFPLTFPYGIPQPGAGLESSKKLVVSFAPDVRGWFDGKLVIESDALLNPAVQVQLGGACSVPNIDVTPSMLDFGRVGLDSSASLRLTVRNLGEANLIVPADEIQVASGADSPFMWLAQDMELETDQQAEIEVNYAPKEVLIDPDTHLAIPHQDTLLISSNDPDENPVEIELVGRVSANLPPVASVRIQKVTKTDGSVIGDPCACAPTDTIVFEGRALDPEGDPVQPNFRWELELAPTGNSRRLKPDNNEAELTPGLTGEYMVCVKASDPQGNLGSYDPDTACTCEEAQANPLDDYDCPCMKFNAFPREDIRVELTWDRLGPDFDLHLVAPGGEFCSPTRDCRFDPIIPDNPDWDRTACVDNGDVSFCRAPNCDPVAAGCEPAQECYDDGSGPACWWRRCSGTDCFWAARNPDWGEPGDNTDDPHNVIDCGSSCRAENTYLNNPLPGSYTVLVHSYELGYEGEATIRIYFKGDVVPSATFVSEMTSPGSECHDTWTVATIDWVDQLDHPVVMVNTHSCLECD